MKIHYYPVSTTSRPLMLFAAENALDIDFVVVDLVSGEHVRAPYSDLNPNRLVPMLEEDDFRLTEGSAILKYLADKIESPAYPREARARARVNERMDWFNTQLSRDLGYGVVYPQVFPNHVRPTEAGQQAAIAWGQKHARAWMRVLDEHLIGPRNRYLCGDQMTIADYFGACVLAIAELVRSDLSAYPNVARWMGTMKALKSWNRVHEMFYAFADSMKDRKFETL
jgi:glutathione S-transferase